MRKKAEDRQRDYYLQTAQSYDDCHLEGDPEHDFALVMMLGWARSTKCKSLLDVGAGTGRVLIQARQTLPRARVLGIEPSVALRNVALAKGLDIIDGSGYNLPFRDASWDLVSTFGVLHHVRRPREVIAEMLRVSKYGVFISDSNYLGQGSRLVRATKRLMTSCRLWGSANYIRTRGRGYFESQEDGIFYSYSVVNDLPLLTASCSSVHIMNTSGTSLGVSGSSHLLALGIKRNE